MPNEPNDIVGHITMADGSHEPLRRELADALWAAAEAAKEKRAADMPVTSDALRMMSDAKSRLRELDWSDACYCPKDGTEFAVIGFGSTGIFRSFYMGEWPKGHLYIDDFLCGVDGHMWKPIDKLTPEEKTKLEECDQATIQHMERDAKMFGGIEAP